MSFASLWPAEEGIPNVKLINAAEGPLNVVTGDTPSAADVAKMSEAGPSRPVMEHSESSCAYSPASRVRAPARMSKPAPCLA